MHATQACLHRLRHRSARAAVKASSNNLRSRRRANEQEFHGLGLVAGGRRRSGSAQALKGPVNDAPLNEKWWPSKWGADDKAGSANHTKNSANIKRAFEAVKQYKSITIGKYYHREAPAFGPRGWQLTIPGTPTGGPFGKNALIYHDELVTAESGRSARSSTARGTSASTRRRGR